MQEYKTFNIVDNPDGYATQIQATSIEHAIQEFKSIMFTNPDAYNIGEDGISNTVKIYAVDSEDETNRMVEHVEFTEDKIINAKNYTFERFLIEACSEVLHDSAYWINPTQYADDVLDTLHNGTHYEDDCGNAWYYEIPARDTKDGIPFVVSV